MNNQLKSHKDTYILSNGVKIPCIGFGTYLMTGNLAEDSIIEALNLGYRHIDTASLYKNESDVGQAIKNSGIPRDEIFVTGKLWNTDQGYNSTLKAFDNCLNRLGFDYLDMYLIHWPVPEGHEDDFEELNLETWRAFEKLYKEKKIRAIGVSNFKPKHLKPLMKNAEIMPMVNQLEIHPCHNQAETVEFCKENNIQVEAWGPLMRGKALGFTELKKIADAHSKSIAQICLRWLIHQDIIPLPKSQTPSRIKENTQIFDFTLTDEEMKIINNIELSE